MKASIITSHYLSSRSNKIIGIIISIGLCFLIIICSTTKLLSQSNPDSLMIKADSTSYMIELTDGTSIIGKLVYIDDNELKLTTESFGKVTILRNRIEKMIALDEKNFVSGKYWFKNPHATRYYMGPSAYTLESGEGYYQNIYLIFQSFNVGVTDYLSIGGGFELLTLFMSDGPGPMYFLTPKVGFEVAENVNLGAGVLYASIPDGGDDDEDAGRTGVGVVYGISTFGNLDQNFTAGLGWAYSGSTMDNKPIITLSAMLRSGRRGSFVTENWIIPNGNNYEFVVSYGWRFFGEQISVDLGFINHKEIIREIPIGIPYVSFVVKFGQK